MIWIYIAAAIFGGGFLIPALIGSLDFDTDVDFDVDADIDADTGAVVAASAVGDWVSSLLTFRTVIFFATFFGAVGLVFSLLDYSEPLPFVSALGLGLVAGATNARLVNYLKRSEVSSHLTQREIAGSTARVILPIAQERRGRVEVDVGGQPQFMVALPFRSNAPEMAPGAQVVVVEVREGTAFVAPLPKFEGGK